MKKFLAISLLAVMTLSFVGCQNSSSNNSSEPAEVSNTSVVASSDNSPTDKSGESSVKSSLENSESDGRLHFTDYESDDVFYIEKVDPFYGDASYQSELESKCETYEFYFTSDGYQIKAYISIPTAVIESQEPCKCLLYNRGGHWNYGSLDSDILAYMCTVTGRVVVACEIRGGNGSGGIDQFGGDELHDVCRLIDLCENKFSFIDMDDFCAIGVSRGGMTTYMTAREDKRVKRIVVAGGISDLISAYNEREDMQEMLRDCIGGTPEEKPEEYKKRSAVYWADEIKIPVLLIHSKGDPKVKYETNAEALYEKLKDSTDCTFISHDDDYHGINPDKNSEDVPEIKKFLNN